MKLLPQIGQPAREDFRRWLHRLDLFVTTEEADDDVLGRLHYLRSTAVAMVTADMV